jgi:DNA-directed RNA polymerase sigma subunit (sigma70/sigma32)
MGKLAVARRHHGAKGANYERILAALRSAGDDAFASLQPSRRNLVQRYYGLDGRPPMPVRELTQATGLTRSEAERQLYLAVGDILGIEYAGVVCEACGRQFIPPRGDYQRRTCGDECARTLRLGSHPSDQQRLVARRQGRAALPQLAALDASAFEILSDVDRELVRLYFGLGGGKLPASQAELSQRFALTRWRLSTRLKQAVARLLDPTTVQFAAERSRSLKIAEARRRQTRRAAAALEALAPQAFNSLPELSRDLVRGFYGLDGDRPWSHRELAQRYRMPVARVARMVNNAVRQLLGDDTIPSIQRTCAVCGSQFTVESRTMPRRACGPACHRELRRRAGQASAAARRAAGQLAHQS